MNKVRFARSGTISTSRRFSSFQQTDRALVSYPLIWPPRRAIFFLGGREK